MGALNLFAHEKQLDNRQSDCYLFLQHKFLVKLLTTYQLLLNSDHLPVIAKLGPPSSYC
jgi:hypothetical protein